MATKQQREREQALREAWTTEQTKLRELNGRRRALAEERRALDMTEPEDILRRPVIDGQIEAFDAAIAAQRARRQDARGRYQKYERWAQSPSARRAAAMG